MLANEMCKQGVQNNFNLFCYHSYNVNVSKKINIDSIPTLQKVSSIRCQRRKHNNNNIIELAS